MQAGMKNWLRFILILGILAIGLAPFWLNDLVSPAAEIIMNKISATNNAE